MKKLLLAIAVLLQVKAHSQSIPNGGFESWTSIPYDEPAGWYTSSADLIGRYGVTTDTKVTGNSGSAIKIQTLLVGNDTLLGSISNSQGNPLQGQGGVPYSQKPTSITGFYKYDLPVHDTALLLVVFKAGGSVISTNLFKIRGTGSQLTFTAFSFPLSLSTTPDSVIIAAASSNAITNTGVQIGSYLELDGLAFAGTGITQAIPNGNFDNWTAESFDKLQGWNTNGAGVTKTAISYSGSSAVRIETVDSDNNHIYPSSITTGHSGSNNGGYPFTNTVDTVTGYYKYAPVGSDTATIFAMLYSHGVGMGGAFKAFNAAANYTYFEMPIFSNSAPDTLRIDISSSNYSSAVLGSVLYIDRLQLKSQPMSTVGINNYAKNEQNYSYPNPVNDELNIVFGKQFSGSSVLSVYDVAGKLVKQENYNNVMNAVQFNTADLKSGIYFYELNNGKDVVRNKFAKK